MPSTDFTPDVAAVGNMLRARTRDDDGNLLGTFTPATTPTAEQCEELIVEAVEEITGILGDDIPERLYKSAKAVAVLLSAMNVELTYYPEQVKDDHSAYPAYERRYNSAMDRKKGWLVLAVKDETTGGPAGPDDDMESLFFFGDFAESGDVVYDPERQTWVLRAPAPSADEGPVLGEWS